MVKRKAAKKTAAKKAPAKKKAGTIADRKRPNGAPRALLEDRKKARKTAGRQAREPKNEQLELIKGVRYADLDRLCRQIGDNRDEINDLKQTGASFEQAALRAMRVHGTFGYNYGGVTLVRNQGDETLTVKRDRKKNASEGSGAQDQPVAPGTPVDDEPGEGQDAGAISDALTEGDGDAAEV